MGKLRIAFVYNPKNVYLCGLRYNNNFSKFYFGALARLKDTNVDYYGINEDFDFKSILGYDAYLLYGLSWQRLPERHKNIESVNPKIFCVGDAYAFEKFDITKDEYYKSVPVKEIRYGHYHNTTKHFKKYCPIEMKYWFIPVGIDPVLYRSVREFGKRRTDKVLLTGADGDRCYPVRTKIKESKYVYRVKPGGYSGRSYSPGKYSGDEYKLLLEKFQGTVASAWTVVLKYFEAAAAGCLVFAGEVDGASCKEIGYVDGENAVVITKKNAEQKIKEFLSSTKDKKWAKIASEGRKLIMSKYTNDECAKRLVEKIKEVV